MSAKVTPFRKPEARPSVRELAAAEKGVLRFSPAARSTMASPP
jgi:hypothetical protein